MSSSVLVVVVVVLTLDGDDSHHVNSDPVLIGVTGAFIRNMSNLEPLTKQLGSDWT